MLELIKKFSQNKIIYVFVVLIFFLMPSVANKPAEAELKSIVMFLGIDKAGNDELEVSASVVTAKGDANISGNTIIVSAIGQTMNAALYILGVQTGKEIGLAHCEAIIVNVDLFEDDVIKYLDFFIRTNNLTTNSILIATESKAKDIVKATTSTTDLYSQSLKNMIDYNDEFLFGNKTNVESFYKAYFSKQQVSLIGVLQTKGENEVFPNRGYAGTPNLGNLSDLGDFNIGLTQNLDILNISHDNADNNSEIKLDSNNNSSSGGGVAEDGKSEIDNKDVLGGKPDEENESGEGQSGGEQSKEKQLLYQGKIMVVKEGKKVRLLTPNEVQIIKIISPNVRASYFYIEDINTSDYKNAKVTFEVFHKNIKISTHFNNDVPVMKLYLETHLKVDEINGENYTEKAIGEANSFITDYVKELCILKIKTDLSELVKNMQEYKTDELAVYDNFYKFHNKKWKKFIHSLEDASTYLENIIFQADVVIKNKV